MRRVAVALGAGALTAGVWAASASAGFAPGAVAAAVLGAAALATGGAVALEAARSRELRLDLERRLERVRDETSQREKILQTVVESAPMAILLFEGVGRVVYANATARELLFEGQPLEGHNFVKMLQQAPEAFREAFLGDDDELFTVEGAEEPETYHLAKRHFERGDGTSTLIMVKHLTRELRRQEVDVWKRLIRVISHELNNSLAPICSLAHSARQIADRPDQLTKLARVCDTIEERARHLGDFLESYARFARLPRPKRARVSWSSFLGRVKELAPWATVGEGPAQPGWFDATQMEQVVVNLLKNAEESGGRRDAISVEVREGPGVAMLVVSDRGSGMTDDVLRKALLPFYSTKERGTGIGLALCREIIEAHSGQLRLQNREGGGLVVTCILSAADASPARSQARLTLSRG